ncbi:hypothetical protein DXG01_012455 [Tephrocybe rancida]|nr:hypothetical protein DXG01_012455 [Tephrocybe rancida]
MDRSTLRFSFDEAAAPLFGPRRGTLVIERPTGHTITLQTPALLTGTSRGVVPHLSRGHTRASAAIGLLHVPFETFLEHVPPVPTLQPGPNALHRFLGFNPDQHILSVSIRDPDDLRDMPPNGNQHLAANSLRGVRKVSPADWTKYVNSCTPDIVVALSDTPYTAPPFSQKRLTKSIERSTAWLTAFLSSNVNNTATSANTTPDPPAPAVLVHLAGSASHPARASFAASLTEPLSPLEVAAVGGLPNLDAGVAGYTIDLKPLRKVVSATQAPSPAQPNTDEETTALIHTSLSALPQNKPRLVHGTHGPHDVLRLVRDVGIDIVEARWAVDAASHGIALDFAFPVTQDGAEGQKKKELGHNLYDVRYRLDFARLAEAFRAASEPAEGGTRVCPCIACSPVQPPQRIVHGSDPSEAGGANSHNGGQEKEYNPPSTRAYLHHLLHTHEMSAHALLVAHNLAVVDALLTGVRNTLDAVGRDGFAAEVRRFQTAYSEEGAVEQEARFMWAEVERARGKGRLAREKEKEQLKDPNGEVAASA